MRLTILGIGHYLFKVTIDMAKHSAVVRAFDDQPRCELRTLAINNSNSTTISTSKTTPYFLTLSCSMI